MVGTYLVEDLASPELFNRLDSDVLNSFLLAAL